jgi:SAM-dependent methyltransferase
MKRARDPLESHWEDRGALEGYVAPVMHSGAPAWFNRATARVQERALRPVLDELATLSPVLELGCGTGRWLRELLGRRADCIGIDRAASMLRKASERGRFKLVRANCDCIPLKDHSVGAALSVTVLQHMRPDGQQSALREVRRVVREDGILCMLERIGQRTYPTVFPRPPSDWIASASDAGWQLDSWRGVEFWPLVRGLSAMAARARGGHADGSHLPAVEVERHSSWRRGAYWGAIRIALTPSVILEPLLQLALPKRAATHGLFVFRPE